MAPTQKRPAKKTSTSAAGEKSYDGFTEAERGAMKQRARELKAASSGGTADEEAAVLAKIAELPDATERAMAERIHELIKANAPELTPKLWYGMPAYYKSGKNVCFFQPAGKFKARYSTFGFNDPANLDDGAIWPVAYALTKLTPAVEKQLTTLIQKAVS
ncbi:MULTISPECIES: iron chaperone [unclassified Kribbella]|uniref:iron chaperone n=1 Tax=unclassified Kribbella TaxID=2644121 RepID=UPI003077FB41